MTTDDHDNTSAEKRKAAQYDRDQEVMMENARAYLRDLTTDDRAADEQQFSHRAIAYAKSVHGESPSTYYEEEVGDTLITYDEGYEQGKIDERARYRELLFKLLTELEENALTVSINTYNDIQQLLSEGE